MSQEIAQILVVPESLPSDFFTNDDYLKQLDIAIEKTSSLVYSLDDEAAMKVDATAINKYATTVDKWIAATYKEQTEQVANWRTARKDKTKKLLDNRQRIIDQFAELREKRLTETRAALLTHLSNNWELNEVKHQFRKATIEHMVKPTGVFTPTNALTKATHTELNRLVAEDKAAQIQYESRVMLIENKCLRADINPPLTVDSFGAAMHGGDFEFNTKLDELIQVELTRAAEKEARLRKQLEVENQRKLEAAIALENDRINRENAAILAKKQLEQEAENARKLEEAKIAQQAEANKVALIAAETKRKLEEEQEKNAAIVAQQQAKAAEDSFYDDFILPVESVEVNTETGEIIEMPAIPMPTVQEMIDHLSHHYGFERHQIRECFRKEFNQTQAA